MQIQENVPLAPLTTMRVGGNARFFCEVHDVDELKEAVRFATEHAYEIFILGGGSNIVFSDDGFDGVVIKIDIFGVEYEDKGDVVLVTAGAGECWDDLVGNVVARGLCGMENLSLIPGVVGASVVQNIGAYGVEVKTMVREVHVFDTQTLQEKVLSQDECDFGYRQSIFKKPEGAPLVVLRVVYVLAKSAEPKVLYGGIIQAFAEKHIEHPTTQDVRDTVIELRRGKLPYEGDLGSAGSFFMNPVLEPEEVQELQKRFPDIPVFEAGNGKLKVPAGWIIDNVCKMKGYREGSVGTYEKQALVIVNHGGATASDIRAFTKKVRSCVKEKTGVTLKQEVEYVQHNVDE
jgi:UDP-N-acetylmuramate dehydrogenase